MPTPPTLILADRAWTGADTNCISDVALHLEGDRIVAVGARRDFGDLARFTVVNFPGTTLLPGLFDSHVHLDDDAWFGPMLLAHGITTVRDTGNAVPGILDLRRRQQAGDWLGPRIFSCGPALDTDHAHWPHIGRALKDSDNIEAVVDELHDLGVDGYKLYVNASPALARRVIARAHHHHCKCTCHAGACSVSEALAAGIDCTEHVKCMEPELLPPDTPNDQLDPDGALVHAMIARFLQARATHCPTLVVDEAWEHFWGLRFNTFAGFEDYPACHRNWIKRWLAPLAKADDWGPEKIAKARRAFALQQLVVGRFHAAGIPLLAGSDAPFVPVGKSLHTELTLLEQSGLTPVEALRAATVVPARYLGVDDRLGALKPGYVADIIAVEGDPTRAIHAIRQVRGLWQSGRQLDPVALLQQGTAAARNAPTAWHESTPPFGIGAHRRVAALKPS